MKNIVLMIIKYWQVNSPIILIHTPYTNNKAITFIKKSYNVYIIYILTKNNFSLYNS